MSDCSQQAWRVPADCEPGVLYMHGHPGTDYAAVRAIEVDGQRFERVRECVNENGNDKYVNFICSQCGLHMYKPTFGRSYVDENGKRWYGTSGEHGLNYCPNCGCKVVGA